MMLGLGDHRLGLDGLLHHGRVGQRLGDVGEAPEATSVPGINAAAFVDLLAQARASGAYAEMVEGGTGEKVNKELSTRSNTEIEALVMLLTLADAGNIFQRCTNSTERSALSRNAGLLGSNPRYVMRRVCPTGGNAAR